MKQEIRYYNRPPQELYNEPANKFVAGFIGSPAMNFFEVNLEGIDDAAVGLPDGQRKT